MNDIQREINRQMDISEETFLKYNPEPGGGSEESLALKLAPAIAAGSTGVLMNLKLMEDIRNLEGMIAERKKGSSSVCMDGSELTPELQAKINKMMGL